MSRVNDDPSRQQFDTYARGSQSQSNQNISTSGVVGQTTYTTTTQNVGYTNNNATYGTTGQTSYSNIGGASNYYNGGNTSYSTVPQSDYKAVNQTYQTTTGAYSQASQLGQNLTQKVVAEEIPVESRIEYIPFEKKYVEYDQVERIERVPFEREIVEYEEVTHTERIPVERTITDYYAVEYQMEFIPKEIEETIVEYEPVERTWERVQYLPVETQIVHYPERDNYVAGQGQYIQAGYVENSSYRQGGATYVPGSTSGVRQETTYQTGYVPTGSSVVQGGYQSGYQQGGAYQSGYQQGATTYTTGQTTSYTSGQQVVNGGYTTTGQTYVTGGSGVRGGEVTTNGYRTSQTGGNYVTGGSGVRGSGVRQ